MSNSAGAAFRRGPIVASLLIAAFVAILSQTLLNVALPSIMDDLNVKANTAQWLSTGYMLVNGVLIPISAYLIERFSTRKLFITAVSLFTVGTLISALATSFEILLTGRIVQAAGAGILMPLMSIVFLTIFPIEQRGKAMGMMGLAMIFAPAVGPTLSGWVVEHHSWRVLFYIVLPISLFGLIYGAISMKNVTRNAKSNLDILGVVLSTLGFGGLLYGFSDAGTDGWNSTTVITSLIVGGLSLILFVWRELTVEKPILEMRVFKYSMYSLTTVINVIVTMAMFSGMILLPIYLQQIQGFSPLKSGLLLLPGAILMGIMSPITGIIFDKVGARWLSVVGLIITVFTTYEFSQLTSDTTYNHMLIMYSLRMFGMSMLMMPIQTAGMNQLPQRLNAHGSGMSQTLRNVAGALGTAFLVTIMSNKTASQVKHLVAANGIDPSDKEKMAGVVHEATIYGINHSFVVATWMSVAALVLAFFIRKVKPHEEPAKDPQPTAQS
ncbi:DHA2 family efflux MFS transporter permease subunit [Paenibacillus sp. MMS18-CY102]|uniref:DHA2 family efflux MFS transporter permease subunit n=1 Tax=Paenibacillus sp. MMS18-CY102 TaxID=2682849 RepID=UPI001366029A|nr:DHA2 family efflux MFS transporter permease subunit [Paenibacillus sp. MMS18-CY102]MWC27971.1 DHA2 family efflux MFS transporter permease subunit [Paenibacillus sp. MMS18-CY102]